MTPEILQQMMDPANHDMLAEKLAEMSAPPQLDGLLAGMPQQQQGGADFGALLAQADQGAPAELPMTMRERNLQQGKPPSGGFAPNKDREWREDTQTLSDEEFKAKWGYPKPGGQ
jgi:hypothetical protein